MTQQQQSERIGTVRNIQDLILSGNKEAALLILNSLEADLLTEFNNGGK